MDAGIILCNNTHRPSGNDAIATNRSAICTQLPQPNTRHAHMYTCTHTHRNTHRNTHTSIHHTNRGAGAGVPRGKGNSQASRGQKDAGTLIRDSRWVRWEVVMRLSGTSSSVVALCTKPSQARASESVWVRGMHRRRQRQSVHPLTKPMRHSRGVVWELMGGKTDTNTVVGRLTCSMEEEHTYAQTDRQTSISTVPRGSQPASQPAIDR
mmetsp:Transcript_10086/g.29116  ORF Transcript_10086/g.29116 Transcript_10086/m.29116 type:complete len:209 (+) Transcript_10086:869-1495(+)